MHPNEEMLTNFYSALFYGFAETMAASYADDATFSDPVFGELAPTACGTCGGCSARGTRSSR